jgi:hypothetical protein
VSGPIAAKPVFSAMAYTEPRTGALTAGAQQALAQWHRAINSIPISVSGEQAQGAGTAWTLGNAPSGNAQVFGVGANGPVPLSNGKGNPWNYSIDGNSITTEQEFDELVASYEYQQS